MSACAYGYIKWRTNTRASSDSGSYWSHHNTATTAGGTTCTLQGQTWTTASSASPTYLWNRQNVLMARGPPRGYGYTRERIGTQCDLNNPNHRCRPRTPESIRVAHEANRKRKQQEKKAIDTSLRLLKSWLSEMEYQYLMEQGQLEVPSQYEKDVIYIVKKDPHEKVKLAHKQKVPCIYKPLITETGEACINLDMEYPVGDNLLSKIALLKSDEKEFLKIANVTHYQLPPATYGAIVEMRGTNFWFILLDDQGQVTHAHETDPSLRFEHITHEEIPCGDNVRNNIIIRNTHQYFIWAPAMLEATVRARELWRERNGPVPGYMATWDPMQEQQRMHQELPHNDHHTIHWDTNNDALVRYATRTDIQDGPTYTVTRLGQEEPYNEQTQM